MTGETPPVAKGVTEARVEAAARALCKWYEPDPDFRVYAGQELGVVPVWKCFEAKARDVLLAALSLPAPGEGAEPVAFRYRGKHKWFYRENYSGAGAADWLPLYEHPAILSTPASGGLAVKALETIAGSHWERVGYCQTDIDDVPDLTANEAMLLARRTLSEMTPSDLSSLDRTTLPTAEGIAIADIAAERRRQIEAEGWTPSHDDQHDGGQLASAAACYALGKPRVVNLEGGSVHLWPWEDYWFKATEKRRNLVKAGALIVAEIERLDRLALSSDGAR